MTMKTGRREFVKVAGAGVLAHVAAPTGLARAAHAPAVKTGDTYDVAVIGAGVFGSWTAHWLRAAGRKVVLIDAYGPGSSRATSGGESRVIRMAYGDAELYTRFSKRSLGLWKAFIEKTGAPLFYGTGVLWMARDDDPMAKASLVALQKEGVAHEKLTRQQLEERYKQIDFGPISWAIWEPDSGILMARRAVQAVVAHGRKSGVVYRQGKVRTPEGKGRLAQIEIEGGATVDAGSFVFACGPWLGKVVPAVLGDKIFPTRQEVLYFGPPAGDTRFAPPTMPVWIDDIAQWYGLPDVESKGFKVAAHSVGEPFDPDNGERKVGAEGVAAAQSFLGQRFPGLKSAPLVASEVCQYENTSNGDFLIDRHPDFENVWLVGGGSGHGFKHGPAVGEYVAARVADGATVDPRFSLATKGTTFKREVT